MSNNTSMPRPDLDRAKGCPRCKGAGVLIVADRVGMKTTRLCLCQKRQRYITKDNPLQVAK